MIKVSIIIPCYNHGAFLLEALKSIAAANSPYTVETIVINDGSTDANTIAVLKSLEAEGHCIVHQENAGLAAARNHGISLAKGTYVIPLDADNKLHNNYLDKAIMILEKDSTVAVVYGNAQYFGEQQGLEKPGRFELGKMLHVNYIDACAVIRKEWFEKTGGYDGSMPAMGNEDWEFWIHIYLSGGRLFYLNTTCFYYRVLSNSMSATTTKPNYVANRRYISKKHFSKIIPILAQEQKLLEYIRTHRFKAIVKLLIGYTFKNDFRHTPEL